MQNTHLNNVHAEKSARDMLKVLIKKYNLSGGNDKEGLQMILENIGKTPLYLAFAKGCTPGNMQVVTLTTADTVFVPLFTSLEDAGKVADNSDVVLMAPSDFISVILEHSHHAVVNPFGDYFLLWPELMRDHMLPYIQEYDSYAAQNFTENPKS